MGKIIAIVLLVIVGAILFRQWGQKLRDKLAEDDEPVSAEPKSAPAVAPQRMVTCAHCGVHLPQAEALTLPATSGATSDQPDFYFCSAEHRAQHAGRPPA